MSDAISNTSPLLYLHRIGALEWLEGLFGEVWIPNAVALELKQGQQKGYDVPAPDAYSWLRRVEPRSLPSEWLALDLGPGDSRLWRSHWRTPTTLFSWTTRWPGVLPKPQVSQSGALSKCCSKPKPGVSPIVSNLSLMG